MSIMTVDDFIDKLQLAVNTPTIYAFGGFGASAYYKSNRKKYAEKTAFNYDAILNAPTGTFFFDCVCLVKGVLWGFNAIPDALYGGAEYCSNNVPDYSIANIKRNLTTDSIDFSLMDRGEFLYLRDEHCGIYIGDGLAIECTPAWKNGVQITQVGNINGISTGYPVRYWSGHGKLPWIEYGEPERKVLVEDGSWGRSTTYYLQLMLGTTPDGIVSGQPIYNKQFCVNCSTTSWEFVKKNEVGSDMVYALQQYIGMPPEEWDRWFGKKTIIALQLKLYELGYYRDAIDGFCGYNTVIGVQRMINDYFQNKA